MITKKKLMQKEMILTVVWKAEGRCFIQARGAFTAATTLPG